jgi:hypothetical protein
MRIVNWRCLPILLLIPMGSIIALPQAPLLNNLFQFADTVLIGRVVSGKRVLESDPRFGIPARPVNAPFHLCEVTVEVKATLKPRDSLVVGSRLTILWYLESSVCAVAFPGVYENLEGRDALLFLSSGRNFQRAFTDLSYGVFPVRNFSPKFAEELAKWKDPNQAVTYLALTPGAIIAKQGYANSHLPSEVSGLVSFREYLNIYRIIYSDSDVDSRGKIAIHLAHWGHCMDAAIRAAEHIHDERLPSFMDPSPRNEVDELHLGRLMWANKADLLKSFANEKEAIDELILQACSSYPKARRRARELLEQYFGITASMLPCVPCES